MATRTSEPAMQRLARTFVTKTAAQGLAAVAARINLNPHCEATVTTTERNLIPLDQTTLAVFRTSPQTGHRHELFVCAIYAYGDVRQMSVDMLVRPTIVDGEWRGMKSSPLVIPGLEDRDWGQLTADHVRSYAEGLFRAALARPMRSGPPRPLLWKAQAALPRVG